MITRREIALAVVVMGFGFAVLYKATEPKRQEQRRYTCYSNLKQIGLGLMQYAQDNDDTYPRASSGREAGYQWMDAILPYVKNTEIFICPSDNINQPYRRQGGSFYGSYVINNAYFLPKDAQTPPTGIKIDKIVSASYTVLVTDGESNFQFAWPDAQHTPALVGDNPFQFDSIRGRHGSGIYRTALTLGCDGSCSTALLDFMRRTNTIKGQKVYTAFTIEDDEPWAKK